MKKIKEDDELQVKEEINIQRDVKKFKASEWAIQKGLDYSLYLAWENLMSEEEFEKLRKIRGE